MSNVEQILKNNNIDYKLHIYSNDENEVHFAKEASEKLWVWLDRIFKTLVVEWNLELFVWVISS